MTETIKKDDIKTVNVFDKYGNNLRNETEVDGKSVLRSNEYTEDGNYPKSSTDSLGFKTSYSYDSNTGYLNSITDAEGNSVNYSYNNSGKVQKVSQGTVIENSFTYDSGDRLSKIIHNDFDYDIGYTEFGLLKSIKAGNGNLINYSYDSKGALTKTDYGNGQSIDYKYNENGSSSSVKQGDETLYSCKYDKDGKPKAILGHSLTLGALGVFILWFCWFGFNGASTVSMEGDAIVSAGKIFVTTNLAAAVATVTVMIITWVRYKKPDVSLSLNGSLAGLVAITAGCDTVSPTSAAIIGIASGFIVVFGIEFIDKVLKIDDPVGAVGVHGLNGAFGTLAVGLFSDGSGTDWKGLLTGGGFHGFGVQFTGMIITIAWVVVTMTIIFQVIKHTIGLRVSAEEEIAGLDSKEHGLASAYDGFAMAGVPTPMGTSIKAPVVTARPSAPAESVPELPKEGVHKLTKVVIITRQNKLDEFMQAMNEIGVTGITITNVLGCGVQKGAPSYYRGVEMEMNLLPKIKIEIVVSLVPVQKVIETAKAVLHTGQIGDGKVFVYDIENVVKIRTGEEGYLALQDTK